MTTVKTHLSRSALGTLNADAASDILSASAMLLTATPEPPAELLPHDRAARSQALVRAAAGTFARVAADILLAEHRVAAATSATAGTPVPPDGVAVVTERSVWRMTVVDLANAVERLDEARQAVQSDPAFVELGTALRQLTRAAERLTAELESVSMTVDDAASATVRTVRLPDATPRQVSRDGRRRPWFGADSRP